MITLVPYGGLANRMKAIDSALALTNDTGQRLRIIWFQDKGLNCRFDQLFLPFNSSRVTIQEARYCDYFIFDRPRRKNFYIPYIFHKILFNSSIEEQASTTLMLDNFNFFKWVKQNKRSYIAACTYFYKPQAHAFFSLLNPTLALKHRIEENTASFNEHTYGIHIRRTDNTASIALSPTELFINKVEEVITTDNQAEFYLASDSEPDKQQLTQRFPKRIHFLDKSTDRNSVNGMQDALVELYTLSRTRTLFGSSASSFSETAARLGKVPYIALRTIPKMLAIVIPAANSDQTADVMHALSSLENSLSIWYVDNGIHHKEAILPSKQHAPIRFIPNQGEADKPTLERIIRIAQDEDFDQIIVINAREKFSLHLIEKIAKQKKNNFLIGRTPVNGIEKEDVIPLSDNYTNSDKQILNIAIAADSAYMVPLTVLLQSIFVNNPNSEIHIYLLYIDSALKGTDLQYIKDFISAHQAFFHPLTVTNAALDVFPETRHSKSALLRLFLPYLASEIDKILYLDGDVIVRKSLTGIYQTDISQHYLAAVQDTMPIYSPHFLSRLGITRTSFYFNSGVCLMNLKELRQCNFMEQGIDFIHKNFDKTGLPDQDFLNYLCQEKVLFLPPEYNFNFGVHSDVALQIWSSQEIKKAQKAPVIVHFVGPVKPWSQLCIHPFRKEWWKYLHDTTLRDYKPKDRNLKSIFYRFFLSVTKPIDALFTLKQKQRIGRLIPKGLKTKVKKSLLRNPQ